MKLPEMRQMLAERGIQLTKSLGQNFLHEEKVVAKIAAAGELTKSDKVLEIGPGLGPLTELLLEKAGEVFAIEKDVRLVDFLVERFGLASGDQPEGAEEAAAAVAADADAGKLGLLHEDALDYLKREPRDWSEWKLVANLPYSVASPILVELAAGRRAPKNSIMRPGASPSLPVPERIPRLKPSSWPPMPGRPGRMLR